MVACPPPRFPHHNLSGVYRLLRLHVPHALLCPQRALFAFLTSFGSTLEVLRVPPSPLSSFTGMDPNSDVDSNEGLQSFMGHVQVPEKLQKLFWHLNVSQQALLDMHTLTCKIFPTSCQSCLLRYGSSFASRTQITAQQLRDSAVPCHAQASNQARRWRLLAFRALCTALHFSFQRVGRARTPTP